MIKSGIRFSCQNFLIIAGMTVLSSTGFCANSITLDLDTLRKIKMANELPSIEQWFFIVPAGNQQNGFETSASEMFVHTGEEFGIGIRFSGNLVDHKIQIHMTPSSLPENFPCSKCKPGELSISEDGRSVVVNQETGSIRPLYGFYWGIDANDPRGQYQIRLSVAGKEMAAYSFEVK